MSDEPRSARGTVIAKRMGLIKDEPKKEEILPPPLPAISMREAYQYQRFGEGPEPQVNASGRVRADAQTREERRAEEARNSYIPPELLSRIGRPGYKWPESTINARKTGETVYERLLAFPNIGYASIERIIQGVVDSIMMGEGKFDQSFGGFMPSPNQFGITDLRAKHYEFEALESDSMILLYGWWDREGKPNTYITVKAGSSRLPDFYMTPYSQGYCLLPEPIIIEPRSSLRVDKDTGNSRAKLPLTDTQLIGYYFAPAYRLIEMRVST